MLNLTPAAKSELQALLQARSEDDGQGLRLRVDKGGCAGWQYVMKVDQQAEADWVLNDEGARVFVDQESLTFLKGCTVDFSDDLTDAGFKIVNPNAARSCGCGTSFEPTSR
ncbi:MAG: iron-sulfur cluster assembly accessory protein [Verrucomicrobiota bacterium]